MGLIHYQRDRDKLERLKKESARYAKKNKENHEDDEAPAGIPE